MDGGGGGNYSNIEDVEGNALVYQNKPVPRDLQDPEQQYCIVSIVGPEGCDQISKQMAIRIYGCKGSLSAANAWAKKLRDANPFYTVFVVQCHQWAALPPRLESVGEMHTNEERVQTIVDQYVAEERGRKQELEERMDAAHRYKTLSPAEQAEADVKRGEDIMRHGMKMIKEGRATIDRIESGAPALQSISPTVEELDEGAKED